MNSALKPVLTASGPQNPPVTAQINKPIHPQGSPSNYGQTSIAPNLVNLPHSNPNANLAHPNPAHQTNHYSLNVPTASQHYSSNNQSTIPASNHPVPNATPTGTGAQNYSPNKTTPFSGGYQPNLGHPPNQQNAIPPVSQTLPATQPPQTVSAELQSDKPQSNGTLEVKSPTKSEENHVAISKEKSPVPSTPPKAATEKPDEVKATPPAVTTTSPAIPEQSKQDVVKTPEETKVSLPTPEPAPPVVATAAPNPPPSSKSTEPTTPSETATVAPADVKKTDDLVENAEPNKETQPDIVADNTNNTEAAQTTSPNAKTKEKEQTKTTPVVKAATPRTPTRKSKASRPDGDSPKTSKSDTTPVKTTQKSPSLSTKSKRMRIRTQPYQSPLPEIEIITKITSSTPRAKNNDDKLIVFYKNEFLAVRNSEGSFYICQAVQNIYKSSPKIRIRWLSQDKNEKSGEVYTPDFYDLTDFDCILTNLDLERVDRGRYRLPPAEKERTDSILKRSIAVEKGEASPSLTEEHPDGIDVSLYKEESQLKKRGSKRKASSSATRKANNTTKSPDQPKARKVAVKAGKRGAAKRGAPPGKRTPTTATTSTTPVDTKKTNASSRTDRAKRRSDNQNHNNKVSPVVDQKKAKVLAKVAWKGATASKSQNVTKNTKAPKATPSSSKVQKPQPKAATRKTKRSKK